MGRAVPRAFCFLSALRIGAFDAKCEAASRGAVYLNVGGFRVREEFFDRRFVFPIVNEFRTDQLAAMRIRFERSRNPAPSYRSQLSA
jgi:hypothetical protein